MNLDPIVLKYIRNWYTHNQVLEYLLEDLDQREVMVINHKGVVTRHISIENDGDLLYYVDKNVLSFHRTIEKYLYPTENKEVLDYDLILDLDFKEDYPYNADELYDLIVDGTYKVLQILFNLGVSPNEVAVKFSGCRGFHLKLLPNLDDAVFGVSIKEGFYTFSRIFIQFLKYYIEPVRAFLTNNKMALDIDEQVATNKHMVRAAYSVNEKAWGVSLPIPIDYFTDENLSKLKYKIFKYYRRLYNTLNDVDKVEFVKWDAKRCKTLTKLYKLSLIWYVQSTITDTILKEFEVGNIRKPLKKAVRKTFSKKIEDVYDPDFFECLPPCIRNILLGMEDGRKRAIFILINFLANIGIDWDTILKTLYKWNSNNKEEIKDKYIEYQYQWHMQLYNKGKRYLPPNCDNDIYYKSMVSKNGVVCTPDELCPLVKNPLVYFYRKVFLPDRNKNSRKSDNTNSEIPSDII